MVDRAFACPSCGEQVGLTGVRPGTLVGKACRACGAVVSLKDVEMWMKQAAIEKARGAIAERNKAKE